MVRGSEYHHIIKGIFEDVRGYLTYDQIQVNCPRCQDNDGLNEPDGKFNLEINTSKKMFRCWKCDDPHFSGSLGKLIRLYGNKADYELYKAFAGSDIDYYYLEEEKIIEPVYLPSEMIYFTQMSLTNPDHIEAYNYLVMERKISREIIIKYKLGFCTSGKYAKRIIIPSYDSNGIINYFVARSYLKKDKKIKPYDNPKSDKNEIIFNDGLINWDSVIYLCEGVFEMLSFPVNTIPMLGKTISPILLMKLKQLKPKVVVLLDPDAYKNTIELYYQLYHAYVGFEDRVKIIKLPNNDDLDELRKNKGIDAVIECLYSARSLEVDDFFYNKLKSPYVYYGNRRNEFN